jgi:hypothetical protein
MLYAAFVGTPLVGLLFVLELGRGVTPTPSVGGRWRVDPSGQPATAQACSTVAAGPAPWRLELWQSGPRLSGFLEDASEHAIPIRGEVQASRVTAGSRHHSAPSVGLHAEISRQQNAPVLSGTFDFVDCPDAAGGDPVQVPFRAIRERPPKGKGAP